MNDVGLGFSKQSAKVVGEGSSTIANKMLVLLFN